MEKLQAAIISARRRRDAFLGPAQGAEPATTMPSSAAAAWEALTPFVPDPKVLAKHRVIANTRGPARNALDMLRTRLLNLMRENGWRRLMITSPTRGCGKTMVAANLALAVQRQVDLSTLLMDFDLIGAQLGKTLGILPEHGVADLLAGTVKPADQMVRVGDNLAVSASRSGGFEHGELLKAAATEAFIQEIDETFAPDLMIFDFPPVFANDEVIAAARFVDCALIVGASEQTSVAELDMTERDLAQYTNIAGVVLNKYRFASSEKTGYENPYV